MLLSHELQSCFALVKLSRIRFGDSKKASALSEHYKLTASDFNGKAMLATMKPRHWK